MREYHLEQLDSRKDGLLAAEKAGSHIAIVLSVQGFALSMMVWKYCARGRLGSKLSVCGSEVFFVVVLCKILIGSSNVF